MSNVRSLLYDSVLRALRTVLARAERGEIASVAIAYETTKTSTGHCIGFGAGSLSTSLLGELEATKMSILISDGRLHPKAEGT